MGDRLRSFLSPYILSVFLCLFQWMGRFKPIWRIVYRDKLSLRFSVREIPHHSHSKTPQYKKEIQKPNSPSFPFNRAERLFLFSRYPALNVILSRTFWIGVWGFNLSTIKRSSVSHMPSNKRKDASTCYSPPPQVCS